MGWCSHCLKSCWDDCVNGLLACPTCGKVLGEVGVRRTSYMKKARLKRMKSVKKRRLGSTGTDPFCSSSSTVIQESNLSTEGSKKATDQGNQLLPGRSHSKTSTKMAYWCTHCLQNRWTELSGDFMAVTYIIADAVPFAGRFLVDSSRSNFLTETNQILWDQIKKELGTRP
ncbi:hypothetical protein CJ030_MR1G012148 [Morella rubra]|uniref:Uncharacterized protein n=1 Tax=Morella rubra TaxID=262757 RepID=A0A6A1WNT7_9ROSI|nr:hypothetical protein CJ030_MR1G012148 [Morella rubra]